MSGLDATLRPVAQQLINKYGKTITYTRQSSGTYDPNTGSSSVSSSVVTIKAVIDAYSSIYRAAGDIESGDVKLTTADIEPSPNTGDTFTIGGVAHQAVNVSPIYTGELVGIYEIQARRA